MSTTVSAIDARQMLGELLDRAFYNQEEFVIERKGKKLAKIVPYVLPSSKKKVSSFAGLWKEASQVEVMKDSIKQLRKRSSLSL